MIVQDRTLVPLRGYMEALGAEVHWQPPATVTVQWEDRTVSLQIGEKTARVGVETVPLDVPAQLINDRTYVPLRFLSEGLGATVEWDGKAVHVTAPLGSRVVIDGPLNVRSSASLTAPVLAAVPVGTRFGVLAADGEWSKVALPGGRTGWIATRFTEPLRRRPPMDPFAGMLAGPTGYLQVQGTCLGPAPILDGQVYVPLAPAMKALGGGVSEGSLRYREYSWAVPEAQVRQVGGEAMLPARTLATGLGLTVAWDQARRTAVLFEPGAVTPGDQACNSVSLAPAYLIMDARSGLVLSEKQANQTRAVASVTKIMTAMLALERGSPDSIVTTSRNAAAIPGASMELRAGDRIRLGDMLYGLMLPSGNDAATAIAEHLSGTEAAFARLMTQRAAEFGATSTLFLNASGLDDNVRPYSTARDMALIAREAVQNPFFRAVASEDKYQFPGPRGTWTLENKNDFVLRYPGATGVKNGWTELADHTLVASAYRDGAELIVVVLGAPTRTQLYAEATRLMDYGFRLVGNAWLLNL